MRRSEGGQRIVSDTKERNTPGGRDHHLGHAHHHEQVQTENGKQNGMILTIRANSGFFGDILLAGLVRITETDEVQRHFAGFMQKNILEKIVKKR